MASQTSAPYDVLRQGLIWGRWKSGERLIPQHLKEELNCTSSVLREAMVRLAGEGFVVSEKNHGFRAVAHSQETFREAAHLRLVLEREAAELALKNGDFEWEMALSAAHQKLAYVEQQMVQTGNTTDYVKHWSLQDWEFHRTLISA
ncbi:MAG: GntR family transcriptional regulator [Roseibium sp.]